MSTPCLIVDIPGPVGPAGADGTNGTNGVNAWTTVAVDFVMPAEGASDVVSVVDASWMAIGQKVFVGDPAAAARGTFEVVAIAANTVTLNNLENTGTGAYTDNSAPGTTFPTGSKVTPTGLQGPAGATPAGAAPDDATYILQTPDASLPNSQPLSALATGLMLVTTATGVVSSVPQGTAAGRVASNTSGLTNGDTVFATATGIETKTAAQTRTALGLVKGTADTNTPQVDDAAGLTNGELLRATAAGIESISNATAQAQLGISGTVGAWAVYQNRRATTVGGGAFASPGWQIVPLNYELLDSGGIASIAAPTITLAGAGTYRIRWRCPAFGVDAFQSMLYNLSTTSVIEYGTNANAATADDTSDTSFGEARLTIGAATNIQLHARCGFTGTFGEPNSFGADEIYAVVEIEKET